MRSLFFFLFASIICVTAYAFCGDRKHAGDSVRSAVRAAEWIRSSLDDTTIGHVRAAAYHSLRLVGYQMTSDDVTKLKAGIDRVGIAKVTTGELGYYVNGIVSSCQNPSAFYGYNLINPLIHGINNYPIPGSFDNAFAYGLAVLALCMSDNLAAVSVDYNLLSNVSLSHGVDTQAMGTMALSCIYKRLKDDGSNTVGLAQVGGLLGKAYEKLRALQNPRDGSFGNSVSTAKAVQGLLSSGGSKLSLWDCPKAIDNMTDSQQPVGSFMSLVMATVQVMPALIGAVPHDVIDLSCPGQPVVYPRHPISVCVRIEFLTSPPNNLKTPPVPAQVTMSVLNGTSAYDILQLAAKDDACYQFTTINTAWGRSIQSICGVSVDKVNKKYWIIYAGDKMATSGIDTFKPTDGSCVIFKYKKF